eukprot:3824538-Amphidinium_carterae.1
MQCAVVRLQHEEWPSRHETSDIVGGRSNQRLGRKVNQVAIQAPVTTLSYAALPTFNGTYTGLEFELQYSAGALLRHVDTKCYLKRRGK